MAWRTEPPTTSPRNRGLGRYLLDGERILTAVHQHWAKVATPIAAVVLGLILVIFLDSSLPVSVSGVANVLWWGWFAVVLWAIWSVFEWRHEWFVATDKRLILTTGLVTQKVAMMPLAKVTDMSYNRSPLGRLLGYGTFVMESAGQDQALHSVKWVGNPDHTYRAICAEIFGVEDHERVFDQDAYDLQEREGQPHRVGPRPSETGDAPPSHPTGPYAGQSPSQGHTGMPGDPSGPDFHGPVSGQAGGPVKAVGGHDADTGPIHYQRRRRDGDNRSSD